MPPTLGKKTIWSLLGSSLLLALFPSPIKLPCYCSQEVVKVWLPFLEGKESKSWFLYFILDLIEPICLTVAKASHSAQLSF